MNVARCFCGVDMFCAVGNGSWIWLAGGAVEAGVGEGAISALGCCRIGAGAGR